MSPVLGVKTADGVPGVQGPGGVIASPEGIVSDTRDTEVASLFDREADRFARRSYAARRVCALA